MRSATRQPAPVARCRNRRRCSTRRQDAILVTDLNRRLTYWNKSAERLYGRTPADVMGRVATHFLGKPFTSAMLLWAVSRAING